MGVGPLELLVILVLALVVFGPDKLPGIARNIGRGVAEFRRMSQELTNDLSMQLEEEVRAKEAPAVEAVDPLPLAPPQETAAEEHAGLPGTDEAEAASDVPSAAPADETGLRRDTKLPPARRRTHRKPNVALTAPALAADIPASGDGSEDATAVVVEPAAPVGAEGREAGVDAAAPDNSREEAGAGPPDRKRRARLKVAEAEVASASSVEAMPAGEERP
ncbi:MAG: twin-arginine translocase TatA/TatE family subunit [Chloroflexi bacterium]|nr:twin-arginine translocase TatA/TatE family subunit [Chloroflexota bacterium]